MLKTNPSITVPCKPLKLSCTTNLLALLLLPPNPIQEVGTSLKRKAHGLLLNQSMPCSITFSFKRKCSSPCPTPFRSLHQPLTPDSLKTPPILRSHCTSLIRYSITSSQGMMEPFSLRAHHVASFLLYLSISFLLLSPPSLATIPSGTIQRTTKQQIIVTIPPNSAENTQPFLTSPSGKYTAYLLRRETAPAAGGFGNDFCYIQVQDTASKESMWESECAPVSTANACSLVFTDDGIEVFDGSESVWNGDGNGESFPVRLDLVDDGDMRVIDKEGELFWRASDDPRSNQGCGLAGSPGLAPESPPFSQPIGTNGNLPFGQQQPNGAVGGQQQQQPEEAPPQQVEQSQPVGVPPPAEAVEAPPQNEDGEEQQPVGAPRPNGVFGQQQQGPPVGAPQPNGVPGGQQQEPPVGAPQTNGVLQAPPEGLNGLNQPSGSGSDVQPLVDNNRYDSGSPRVAEGWVGMSLGLASLLVYVSIF